MNCGSGVEREDRFCGQCGHSLARQFGRDDSQGRKRALPDLRRVDIRPFIVRGRQVKVEWLFWPICAVMALMAIGFMTSWGTAHAFVWFVLLALASIAFKPANDLRRVRHARLWGATSLESNQSGKLFITELGGECPLCGGELTLRSERGGFDDNGRRPFHTVVACRDHRDHHWPFNPLALHPLRNERDAPERHSYSAIDYISCPARTLFDRASLSRLRSDEILSAQVELPISPTPLFSPQAFAGFRHPMALHNIQPTPSAVDP